MGFNRNCHVYLADTIHFQVHSLSLYWHDENHREIIILHSLDWKRYEGKIILEAFASKNELETYINSNNEYEKRTDHDITTTIGLFSISLRPAVFGKQSQCIFQFPKTASFFNVQTSLDRRFYAFQLSDIEVEVKDAKTADCHFFVITSKRDNQILPRGLIWGNHSHKPDSSQDLYVITKRGIEHHKISSKRKNIKFSGLIKHQIYNHWYNSESRLLIFNTRDAASELRPYLLMGLNPIKLPKLNFSNSIHKNDLYICKLYGETYIIHADICTPKLVVYSLMGETIRMLRVLRFNLFKGCPIEFSVVDNLLICHCKELSISFFYDIQSESHALDPFLNPLPIGILYPEKKKNVEILQTEKNEGETKLIQTYRCKSTKTMQEELKLTKNLAIQRSQSLYLKQYKDTESNTNEVENYSYVSPFYVKTSYNIKDDEYIKYSVLVRVLKLNLHEICDCSSRHWDLSSFLLRRSMEAHGKIILLNLLYQYLAESVDLSLFTRIFTVVQDSYLKALGERAKTSTQCIRNLEEYPQYEEHISSQTINIISREKDRGQYDACDCKKLRNIKNSNGIAVILQKEFYNHLWLPASKDEKLDNHLVFSALCEYIRSLHHHDIAVESYLYFLLVKYWIKKKQFYELYQFLQYHIPEDSFELAELIIAETEEYPPLHQLVIDIFLRLGKHIRLIQGLLEDGNVLSAMKFYRQNRPKDSSETLALDFFNATTLLGRKRNTKKDFNVFCLFRTLHQFLKHWFSIWLVITEDCKSSLLARKLDFNFPNDLFPDENECRQMKEIFGFYPTKV